MSEKFNYVVTAAGRIAGVPCEKNQVVRLTETKAKYENVILSADQGAKVEGDVLEVVPNPAGEADDDAGSDKGDGKSKRGKSRT